MLSLSAIHAAIETLSDQLEDLVSEIAQAGDEAAKAEADFKTEFAKARLWARANAGDRKITVDEVEDRATTKTTDERTKYLVSANTLLVLREALRARQAQLDGYRTLAASYRGAGG